MLHAIERVLAGTWPREEERGIVTLSYDARCRRRIRLSTDSGEDFLLDLPEAAVLADGDAVRLEEGGYIRVCAAEEKLMRVSCRDTTHFARIAWHLGNRHLPAEIEPGVAYIRPDHVIEDMLEGLGASISPIMRPFNPEGGAYSGHVHAHGEGQAHRHSAGAGE